SGKDTLLPSDNTVAGYWITNPDNTFIDNVAAGSEENGFWLSLPEHPQGQFEGTDIASNTWPRRTKMGTFKGNVAHSTSTGSCSTGTSPRTTPSASPAIRTCPWRIPPTRTASGCKHCS